MFPAADVLLSTSAEQSLSSLESSNSTEARSIVRRARALRSVLLADCLHGEVVRKGALPQSLKLKYGFENLFVEDLPSFWRLLYTVVRQGGKRVVVVVEIVDHRAYDKWFPGRRR
jgi:hypothetical protein